MKTKTKPNSFPQLKAQLLSEAEEDITFTCPVRGKVTQRVKVQKFASVQAEKVVVLKENSVISSIEEEELQRVLLGEDD